VGRTRLVHLPHAGAGDSGTERGGGSCGFWPLDACAHRPLHAPRPPLFSFISARCDTARHNPTPPPPLHVRVQLSAADEAALRAAGYGYRAKFIAATVAALAADGGEAHLLSLRGKARAEVQAALTKYAGVGECRGRGSVRGDVGR
jgi:hypothetical protein